MHTSTTRTASANKLVRTTTTTSRGDNAVWSVIVIVTIYTVQCSVKLLPTPMQIANSKIKKTKRGPAFFAVWRLHESGHVPPARVAENQIVHGKRRLDSAVHAAASAAGIHKRHKLYIRHKDFCVVTTE